MIRKTALAAALGGCLFAPAAPAQSPGFGIDGASLEAGAGEGTRMWRASVHWNWERKWFAERSWNLVGYWDLTAGVWERPENNLTDLGLTPTFRLQQRAFSAYAPYFEAAIGFHLLSEVRIGTDKVFSTNFQFGDHVGAGIRFGPRHQYDVSLRLQHLSNGGIRRPNPGIDFLQLRLAYHFR